MSVMGGFAASALFAVAINPVNLSIRGLCPGLHTHTHTQGTIIPMDAPDIPPPPTRQVHQKPTSVCQSHNSYPQPFPFSTPPTPTTRTLAPFLFIILLLCNYLDDNALHINGRAWHYIWTQWRQFVYMGHTSCPAKYQWCMHIVSRIQCIPCFCRSLVTPSCSCAQITKSCSRVISIHLCGCTMCAMRTKATSQSRLRKKKKSSLSRSRFQAIFPGFISKSSGVENSILKEKWRGGGESWMKKKKEGGLRGYNPTTSKKKSQSFSFSYAFHVYHFHEGRFSPKSVSVMMKMPRIGAGDGRIADKHLIWMRPFSPSLLPFLLG